MKLNFHYYTGQTFDLNQETMNKMIDDIRNLIHMTDELKHRLKDVTMSTNECELIHQTIKDAELD